MGKWDALIKGALLHDIGKVVYRANQGSTSHSKSGADFIEPYFSDMDLKQNIIHCLKYHHGKDLSSATLKNDDYAYIVYEADNIAAAVDRRDIDEGDDSSTQRFDKGLPLQSIFRVFGGHTSTQPLQYYLRGIDASGPFNYPENDESIRASSDKYKELYDVLEQNFQKKPIDTMTVNELLRIYEDTVSYMPSSTATNQANDISLYMHSKITAAVAHCMVHYFEEQGIEDYKTYCYQKSQEFRNMPSFKLISGDISGIQNFIYTIPSKGALKSLRGRSFYLEILMEQIVDELLDALQLTRANLIYNGGGHFYVLAPNTKATDNAVASMEQSINEWFLTVFGTKLYLALGTATATASDLIQSEGQSALFRKVSECVAEAKSKRYSEHHLRNLFNPNSAYNTVLHGERECSICHTSTTQLISYGESTDTEACPLCDGLYRLGKQIVDNRETVFVLAHPLDSAAGESIPHIEVYVNKSCSDIEDLKLYLYVVPKVSLETFESTHNIVRIYAKNTAKTGHNVFNRIWLADYVARKDNGQVYEFEELAASSGLDNEKGIKRLGVLRADVDNLGAAFSGGFISSGPDRFKFGTLSRYADLSRDLAMFFKVAVNKMVQGDVQGFGTAVKPFTIWPNKQVTTRNIHVIYSGGDDVFLVGAWDELLELAIDIRKKLKAVTDDKITMSAGLALFSPSYPISQMAAITGLLESAAKDNTGKDSIALFGFETNTNGEERICRHVYKWNDLIENVIEDKIFTLNQLFIIPGIGDSVSSKLKLGKGLIYKLMDLLQGILHDRVEGKHINTARILYLLARLEPKKHDPAYDAYKDFTTTIHKWIQTEEDCKALLTACNLIVYYMRDKK